VTAVADLRSEGVTMREACEVLGIPRANYYRWRQPKATSEPSIRPSPPRTLAPEERQKVLDVLHDAAFVDRSPTEVYATLLEQGQYLCSSRTMYRILAGAREVRERRNQCRRPSYQRPELLATAPNQVWSWDLTKLRSAQKWTYYHLYVVLDIYSRYVVAWMLAHRESGELARDLVTQAYEQEGIEPGQLVVHSDRGSAPKSKTLNQLYADLGIDRSLSRPYVSDDNPYSESGFKTLKYSPGYPGEFGSYEHALGHCREFFPWYNHEHHHSGIAYLTPEAVHRGRAEDVLAKRQRVLDDAWACHPERFVRGAPQIAQLPGAVWINPPEDRSQVEISLQLQGECSLN
jgi:putative transposase